MTRRGKDPGIGRRKVEARREWLYSWRLPFRAENRTAGKFAKRRASAKVAGRGAADGGGKAAAR